MPDFSFGTLGTRKLRDLQVHYKHVAGNAYKYVAGWYFLYRILIGQSYWR